ncbi:hypothetical protein [Micromonospora sp. DT62]|uniref:hypothetical protein n=1 Tax=Micromonospora sp. DT62 TaxID=3416521 RepID=UPI003CEA647E
MPDPPQGIDADRSASPTRYQPVALRGVPLAVPTAAWTGAALDGPAMAAICSRWAVLTNLGIAPTSAP